MQIERTKTATTASGWNCRVTNGSEANGTHLQGYVNASYARLVELLGPCIDGDVEDGAGNHAYQLGLWPRELEVQASHGVLDGARLVVLHEGARRWQPRLGEPGPEARVVVAFHERATLVLEHGRLDDHHIRNIGANQLHGSTFSCNIFIKYCP